MNMQQGGCQCDAATRSPGEPRLSARVNRVYSQRRSSMSVATRRDGETVCHAQTGDGDARRSIRTCDGSR
jgi:hypothetical protein